MTLALTLILVGLLVGFVVGLTGVGGGSLLTPVLIYLGFSPLDAVGTDLVYATVTKASGVYLHSRRRNVDWPLVGWLLLGSLPASALTVWALHTFCFAEAAWASLMKILLGSVLILTGIIVVLRLLGIPNKTLRPVSASVLRQKTLTVALGFFLGVLVTLSSAGAGAVGAAALSLLFPQLCAKKIMGSDFAHAVPLTLVAGLAHLATGHVNLFADLFLLVGSLPAFCLGTWLTPKVPDKILKSVMGSILAVLGVTLL